MEAVVNDAAIWLEYQSLMDAKRIIGERIFTVDPWSQDRILHAQMYLGAQAAEIARKLAADGDSQ
jgi:hypothetical protein